MDILSHYFLLEIIVLFDENFFTLPSTFSTSQSQFCHWVMAIYLWKKWVNVVVIPWVITAPCVERMDWLAEHGGGLPHHSQHLVVCYSLWYCCYKRNNLYMCLSFIPLIHLFVYKYIYFLCKLKYRFQFYQPLLKK